MVVALVLLGALFAIVAALIFALRMRPLIHGSLNDRLFDTLFGYQPAAIGGLHTIYAGDPARNAVYRQEVWWDNRLVVAYSAMALAWWFAAMAAWGGTERFVGVDLIALGIGLALLGGIGDLVENRLVLVALRRPSPLPSSLVGGLSLATNLKWLGNANLLLLLGIVVRHLFHGAG